MGNEASARALIHNLEELEVALREHDTNQNDLKKNGWDAADCSDNIEVFDSGLKIRRGGNGSQSDAIRGKSLYCGGVHFFQFTWSRNGDSNKIVSIGVATQEAALTASAKSMVLGSTDQSVGLNLVSKQIFFNDCPVKNYPPGKPSGFKLPEKIIMVLDLDNGTLGFKTDREDYGVAMTGLRHISQDLCIAGELNKAWDELTVRYMGSSGNVKDSTVLVSTPRTPGSGPRGGITPPRTADEFMKGLETTIEELKEKDAANIDKANQMVEVYMDRAFFRIDSERLQRLAAERLATINGAQVITEYHNFLLAKRKGNPNIMQFVYTLRSVCINYCHCSLVLCTKFGESGFLEDLIKFITGKSRTYTKDEITKKMVTSAIVILDNCSKATDNKPIYRKNRFVQAIFPYTHPDYHSVKVVLTALFGISYVCEENEYRDVKMGRRIAQEVVNFLSKAVVKKNHEEDGWNASELAVGMSNVAVNPDNSKNLVHAGAIKPLTQMLDFEKNYEKECALNAIWSLTLDDTKTQVAATDGLLNKVDKMTRSDNEDVKQSAIRVKMKLQGQQQQLTGSSTKRDCQYAEVCIRFKKDLNLADAYFNDKFSICFCAECHGSRGEKSKYARGSPPKNYGIPVGWYKFGLQEPPKAKALKAFEKWHRAFHGTVKDSLESILKVGEIVPAGRPVLGGKKIKELPGHFCEGRKPAGFDTKQLFLSPSMRYSGVDAYARPCRFQDKKTGKTHNAKVAFQVLISPDSYKVGPETIGARTEIDPDFSNQEMEWSTNQQGCHTLSGLLVKLY